MNNFSLIKALLHGADFYWKKFFVLSMLLVIVFGGFFLWRTENVSEASSNLVDEFDYTQLDQQNIDIQVLANGKVLSNGKNISSTLKLFSDHDEIRIILVDNSENYTPSLVATVTMPKSFQKKDIEQATYAVHGIESYRNYVQDSKTLVYEATNVMPGSTLSILVKFPKNMVKPSIFKQLGFYISSVSAQSYLVVAFILPLLTLGMTLFMLVKRRKDQFVALSVPPSTKLPAKVSPAVVGVLLDGQIGTREIAATLIDLAERKFIYIVRKGEGFTFGKRKAANFEESTELKTFEKILLSKIFTAQDYKSTRDDVEMRVGHHIFSRKMAQVFLDIYDEATRANYFVKNPEQVHRLWRYTGIILFFLSILGFIQSAAYAPDPKFTLFFWVGSLAAASVIIKISGLMPARSKTGSQALGPWMAFRKYLKMNEPIIVNAPASDLYLQNLPYAIVFGVEDVWAKRFLNETFTKPDWYDSEETNTTLEEFIGGLYPLISFVGGILANSHEPTVE